MQLYRIAGAASKEPIRKCTVVVTTRRHNRHIPRASSDDVCKNWLRDSPWVKVGIVGQAFGLSAQGKALRYITGAITIGRTTACQLSPPPLPKREADGADARGF